MQYLRLIVGYLVLGIFATPLLWAGPQPASEYVRRPEVSEVKLSEDGKWVSFLTPGPDRFYILNLFDTATGNSRKFDLGLDEVFEYKWLDEQRLLLTLSSERTKNRRLRQAIFDASAGAITRYIADYIMVSSALRRDNRFLFCTVYSANSRSGPGILNLNRRADARGDTNILMQDWISVPTGDIYRYQTDIDGELRAIDVFKADVMSFYYRRSPEAEWIKLPLDYENTRLLGFDKDPDYVYIGQTSTGSEPSATRRFQVSTGIFGPALYSDPFYSLQSATLRTLRSDTDSPRPLSITYNRNYPVQIPLDPEFGALQKEINTLLPGRLNLIEDTDNHLQHATVASYSGRDVRYLVYTRKGNSLMALPDPFPWINPQTAGLSQPVRFAARDGTQLEGYLILPPPRADGAKPPLLVQCLDNLRTRFVWGMDSTEQFYISRGYAIFQPNTRGATGFNHTISIDGAYDLDLMQTDVIDGVQHLIAQGLINPDRIAIQGKDFGALTALSLAERFPGTFKCAILSSGVYDWDDFMQNEWANQRRNKYAYAALAKHFDSNPDSKTKFEAMSPIKHVGDITAPLLIVYPEYESESRRRALDLVKVLNEHQVTHEDLEELHFMKEKSYLENPQRYLEAAETFLAKHL